MSPRGGSRPGAGRKRTLADGVNLVVYVERAIVERAKALAKSQATTISAVIREALVRFIDRVSARGGSSPRSKRGGKRPREDGRHG